VTERGADGTWSEPRVAVEEWPAWSPKAVYYGGWIFVERGPETLRILNAHGPPPPEAQELVRPLFDMMAVDPVKVVTGPDGQLIAVFMSAERGGFGQGDIFTSRYVDGAWSEPENLGEPINTPRDEVDFCITSDGRTIYLSASRSDAQGGEDIYVSRRTDAAGGWSQPERVPALSSTDDDFPYYLSPDDATLYLGVGHNRQFEPGGSDVYDYATDIHIAQRGEDGRFGTTRPVSKAVNAASYDDFLHLSPDGRTLFFVSSRRLESARD
jgi:hypothetical protein